MTDSFKMVFSVHLFASVVDRDTQEVLVPEELLVTLEAPSLYYYEESCIRLKAQILHLARVRFVYMIQARILSKPALAKKLEKRDWMVQINEAQCTISPSPTEEIRLRGRIANTGQLPTDLRANENLRA